MLLSFFVLGLLVIAAIYDIQVRQIPLWLTISGFFAVSIILCLILPIQIWPDHWMSFGLGLIIFYFGWKLNIWGGGDAKLLMVVFLSVPWENFWECLLLIFMAGGLQALTFMIYYYWFRKGQKITHLPYALAILGGYSLWMFLVFY